MSSNPVKASTLATNEPSPGAVGGRQSGGTCSREAHVKGEVREDAGR